MVGFLMVNVVHPVVQPFGGASRVFGTNPISVAVPAGEQKPFLLDFATSSVAEGKVGLAAMNKENIPLGWIVDSDGHETNDPLDFCLENGSVGENGRLLSYGAREGHKGYCFSILMEILGGILPGAGSIIDERVHLNENGLLAIALDIKRFTTLQRFKNRMDSLFQKVHSAPVDPEFQYSKVQVPGEYEWRNREKRLGGGIDVPQVAWDEIQHLAAELNINSKLPSNR